MSSNPTPPPPGWYPAPDGSTTMWWWDGAQWAPTANGTATVAPRSPRGFVRLSLTLQACLLIAGIISLSTIGIELFGLGSFTAYVEGDDSALRLLETYDQLYLVAAIGSLVAGIANCALWAIWQYKAAKRVPGRTRRTPGWHAGSWFIPVVNFWFPYQNVADLWRAIGRTRPWWQIAWWISFLLSSVVIQISTRISLAAQTPEDFSNGFRVSIFGEALFVGSMVLAVLIVRGITQGIQQEATNALTSFEAVSAEDTRHVNP